jgi:hypothetical protein
MDFIQGIIPSNLVVTNYYAVINSFNIPLFRGRFDDDGLTDTLELDGDEVIRVRWFKPKTSNTIYTYIDGYYKNDEFFKVERE